METTTQKVQKLYSEFILPTYAQIPVCLVRGEGSRVWDSEGKEYLDFFPGWAVSGLGHCHPKVVAAIREQAGQILHISNNFLNQKQAELAREISQVSFPAKIFFCNSGAEATEGAIKFARKYGSESGRFEIITMKQSFHGRTLAALTATGQEKVKIGFAPLPEGFRYAEFNDIESVKAQITPKTIAIFLEPIQGEGGVRPVTQEFMQGLKKLCEEKDLLLMVDEVQTGMGRTGKMFGYQHFTSELCSREGEAPPALPVEGATRAPIIIEPDVMTLAKSLGGGVPIGAFVVSKRIKKEIFTPGSHGSTYGGNPLVAAAALAVFQAIREEKLLENTIEMGQYLRRGLEKLKEKFGFIKEVRGFGLMQGMELSVSGAPYVNRAREKGLLINCTQDTVLRIMPAMTVTKEILDKGLAILKNIFSTTI